MTKTKTTDKTAAKTAAEAVIRPAIQLRSAAQRKDSGGSTHQPDRKRIAHRNRRDKRTRNTSDRIWIGTFGPAKAGKIAEE